MERQELGRSSALINIQRTEGRKCVSENVQNKKTLSLSLRFSHDVQPKLGRWHCVNTHCTAELSINIVILKIDVIAPRSRR